MSIKHPFFPNGQDTGEENTQQDHGEYDGGDHPQGDGHQHRQAAKGHAAYAANEGDVKFFRPRGSGFGPIGGLYADDAAAPSGHGLQSSKEESSLPGFSREALHAECLAHICPDCPVKKEADDVRLRSLAELENARKRLTRERDEQVRFAAEAVLADIAPSLDNLDLALQHAGDNEACKNLLMGVQMTRKLLLDALQKHGLELVGKVGEPFDPAFHEAVGMADAPEVPDSHVCALLSTGYKLKERLLRPARVMVCRKE